MEFKHSKSMNMSPMEIEVSNMLIKNNIEFYREVSFSKLINPKTGNKLRYDFYLPKHKLFIEYDGLNYHNNTLIKERDSIKDNFAQNNGFKLIRLSGTKSLKIFEYKYLNIFNEIPNFEIIYSKQAKEKSKTTKVRIKRTKDEIKLKQIEIKKDRLSKINNVIKYKEPIKYNNSIECEMF